MEKFENADSWLTRLNSSPFDEDLNRESVPFCGRPSIAITPYNEGDFLESHTFNMGPPCSTWHPHDFQKNDPFDEIFSGRASFATGRESLGILPQHVLDNHSFFDNSMNSLSPSTANNLNKAFVELKAESPISFHSSYLESSTFSLSNILSITAEKNYANLGFLRLPDTGYSIKSKIHDIRNRIKSMPILNEHILDPRRLAISKFPSDCGTTGPELINLPSKLEDSVFTEKNIQTNDATKEEKDIFAIDESFGEIHILDSTPQPCWDEILNLDEEEKVRSPQDIIKQIDKLIPPSPRNANEDAKRVSFTSISKTSNGSNMENSRDAKEMLQNLTTIVSKNLTDVKAREECENILQNLSHVICPMTQTVDEAVDNADLRQGHNKKSLSMENIEKLSSNTAENMNQSLGSASATDDNNCVSNNLEKQTKVLNSVFSKYLKGNNGVENNKFKFAKIKTKGQSNVENSTRGPLKALRPFSNAQNIIPKQTLTDNKKNDKLDYKKKRTSTPNKEKVLKPMAQSTPKEEKKENTNPEKLIKEEKKEKINVSRLHKSPLARPATQNNRADTESGGVNRLRYRCQSSERVNKLAENSNGLAEKSSISRIGMIKRKSANDLSDLKQTASYAGTMMRRNSFADSKSALNKNSDVAAAAACNNKIPIIKEQTNVAGSRISRLRFSGLKPKSLLEKMKGTPK